MTPNPTELYTMFMARRKMLLPTIYERTNSIVQHGPFKDMKILPNFCWGDGDVAGKLLGLYEDELYTIIEKEIAKDHDLVINYGCAEGFYGVGLAKRLPESRVVLFDIAPEALAAAKENAEANGVTNIEFTTECTHAYVESLLATAKNPLVVMDCEGAEVDVLDLSRIPSLKNATVLVETHDCLRPGITEKISQGFDNTHKIELILQGTKNLYIDPIHDFTDVDKMILNCENRPSTMGWLYMNPWGDGSKYGITSIYNDAHAELAAVTWTSKQQYADKHGYKTFPKTDNFSGGPIHIDKLHHMLAVLNDNPALDWLWWLDNDAMITNHDELLENIADYDYHVIISTDCHSINTGSFMIRNSPETKAWLAFLLELAKTPEYADDKRWFEQQMVIDTYVKYQDIIKIVPQRTFNSYQYAIYQLDSTDLLGESGEWAEGDFVIHWPAIPNTTRLKLAAQIAPLIQDTK
jgi:hypothetical protein